MFASRSRVAAILVRPGISGGFSLSTMEQDPFEQAVESLRQGEAKLLASYEQDLGSELRLVDEASALLFLVLARVGKISGTLEHAPETGELSGDVDKLKLMAQVFIGIRTFRVIRAGRAVLAFGYEREAPALDRILVELQAHRRTILKDESGEEALAWLARERKYGIGKKVSEEGPEDLYDNLSADAHGDPTPVNRLQDRSGDIDLSPRRGFPTRASLIELYAGMARDQAVLIAGLAGVELRGVDELDRKIIEAKTALARDFEAAESE
jgi:hypothetical protein